MISSISSSSIITPQSSQSSTSSSSNLTSSQLDTISSVLENYDASNLSASDAQSIVQSFQEAGIEPSAELVSAMEEAGFDAQEVGGLAGGKQGGMPPPPPPSDEEITSISSLLDSLLTTSDEDGSSTTTTSFEDILDYTSQILSLDDTSKDKVMSLLDKYSNEDSDYSQSEINTILKASLSEILSDSNNYKSVSFYG
ncbi:MAG: hypothetical protein RBR65_03850 [Aliarcobacter sp.]|jgi:hypothetical protein|nr:hypothetical protein [Aliarcobacter sp.]